MFEINVIAGKSKKEKYELLLPQIAALVEGERNIIANTANISAALKASFEKFNWAGFYFTDEGSERELVLGPFQGKAACIRIPFGKGVCGACASEQRTIVVKDVDSFPGHIACDADSKSEITVPVVIEGKTVAVLDIDSSEKNYFDEVDKKYLEKLISDLQHIFRK